MCSWRWNVGLSVVPPLPQRVQGWRSPARERRNRIRSDGGSWLEVHLQLAAGAVRLEFVDGGRAPEAVGRLAVDVTELEFHLMLEVVVDEVPIEAGVPLRQFIEGESGGIGSRANEVTRRDAPTIRIGIAVAHDRL